MYYVCVFSFGTFLELTWHLQSTRSRGLLNEFWCCLVQNKVESLLVLFLLFPAHFYCVENNKHFNRSLKLRFPPLISVEVSVLTNRVRSPRCHQCQHESYINMQYWNFLPPQFFFVTFQVDGLWVSAQTEQSAMWSARSRKSIGNENAYHGRHENADG